MPARTLKQCMKEANAILLPPNPLPTATDELAKRLGLEPSPIDTRADLQTYAGIMCLQLLADIHAWLEKEYWPVEHRDGLEASDFLLGTADLRLIRALCAHVNDLVLLPLSIEFHKTAATATEDVQDRLSETIAWLLRCMDTSPPPISTAGPSSQPSLPPTVVGQIIATKYLRYVYLSCTLFAYAPTIPAAVHQNLRTQLLRSWNRPGPTGVISAIGAAMRLQRKKGDADIDDEGWNRCWPGYVRDRLGWQMSTVILRPGGARAIMGNVFGEDAVLQAGRGVDTDKLDAVARAIIASQGTTPISEWIPKTLHELLNIIAASPGTSQLNIIAGSVGLGKSSPPLFINAACYTIFRIWSSHTKEATEYLDEHVQNRLPEYMDYCKSGSIKSTKPSNPPGEMQKAVNRISALSIHTPFSPEFLDYLIGRNLSILISLRQYLFDADAPAIISAAGSPGNDAGSELSKMIHQILLSWAGNVGLEDGVRRITEASRADEVDGFELDMIIAEADRPDLIEAVASKAPDKGVGDRNVKGDKQRPHPLPRSAELAALMQDQLQMNDNE